MPLARAAVGRWLCPIPGSGGCPGSGASRPGQAVQAFTRRAVRALTSHWAAPVVRPSGRPVRALERSGFTGKPELWGPGEQRERKGVYPAGGSLCLPPTRPSVPSTPSGWQLQWDRIAGWKGSLLLLVYQNCPQGPCAVLGTGGRVTKNKWVGPCSQTGNGNASFLPNPPNWQRAPSWLRHALHLKLLPTPWQLACIPSLSPL